MGRARLDSRVTNSGERRVHGVFSLKQRRTPGEQAADARARAAGERVYKNSALLPIGRIVTVAREDGVCRLELAASACTAELRALDYYVLGRGDSIIALARLPTSATARTEDGARWQLETALDTAVAAMHNEKLRGARVYAAYAALDAEERVMARAFAAALPAAWLETMVSEVK